MENNHPYTLEQMKEFISGNIEHYKDFEEYAKYNPTTLDDFEKYQNDGFIQDITYGTYDGADSFTPWATNNLISAIIQDIREADLYESLVDYVEGTRNIDYALTYTEIYQVFTIDNHIYADFG